MVDDMPQYDGTEPANLKTLNNGQSSAADAIHQQMLDQIHADDAVDTVEDLPTTGNWVGRETFVIDDQRVYRLVGLPATWVRDDQLGWAATTPTRGAGWDTPAMNNLLRRGGFAYLEFNAFRTTDLAVGGTVVDIPAGYRGDLHRWTEGWAADDPASGSYQIFYNPIVHKVQTREVIPTGASLAVSIDWPLV